MDCFNVTILGCGSAKPTPRHAPTAQVVNFRGSHFLIDCGEGVQVGLAKAHVGVEKIRHIFISHLHGDHCLGLTGLIASMGLSGRTAALSIFAPPMAEDIFRPLFDFFCPDRLFPITFVTFDTTQHIKIYEDRTLEVYTLPLHHRVPTAGFLFVEKPRERHLNLAACEAAGIPIAYYKGIKRGADYVDSPTGVTIPNDALTTPPTPSKRYAYCSDTLYAESLLPYLTGCDLLYHEATYLSTDTPKAHQRGHSTALEAATLALKAHVGHLVIGHFSSQFQTDADESLLLQEASAIFPHTTLAHEQLVLSI